MALNLQALWQRKVGRALATETFSEDFDLRGTQPTTLVAGPHEVLGAFGLRPGDRTLEVGGWGIYSAEAARRLGSTGHLVCIDIVEASLCATRERVAAAGVDADFVHASVARLPLRSASFDHVLLIGVLSQMSERGDMLMEFRRILRLGARLSVSEPLCAPDSVEMCDIHRDLLVAGFVRDNDRDWLEHTSSWIRVA